jgi:hypothetical protein
LYPILKVNEDGSVTVLGENSSSMTLSLETIKDKYTIINKEKVNHPKHYNRKDAMECIDEMLLLFGEDEVKTFCKLNAWKYRYRSADKNGDEDLKKSDWYLAKYKELNDVGLLVSTVSTSPYNISTTPCTFDVQYSDNDKN